MNKLNIENIRNDIWIQILKSFYKEFGKRYEFCIAGKYLLYKLHDKERECNLDLLVYISLTDEIEKYISYLSSHFALSGCHIDSLYYKNAKAIFCLTHESGERLSVSCVFRDNKESCPISVLELDNLYYNFDLDDVIFSRHSKHDRLVIMSRECFYPYALYHPDVFLRVIKYSVEFDANISFYIIGILDRILNDEKQYDIFKKAFSDSILDIRDEFLDIMKSPLAGVIFSKLNNYKLLDLFLPEISDLINFKQNKRYSNNVFDHTMRALNNCSNNILVRFATLYHDCGKPSTMLRGENGITYYNHELVSADMAERSLIKFGFGKQFCKQVAHIIKYHMYVEGLIKENVSDEAISRFIIKTDTLQRHIILLAIADKLSNVSSSFYGFELMKNYYMFYYKMNRMLRHREEEEYWYEG